MWTPEALEAVDCSLCNSRLGANHTFRRPDGLDIKTCKGCGLGFLSPRPTPTHVKNLYNSNYYQNRETNPLGYQSYHSRDQFFRIINEQRANFLSKRIELRGRSVLDVGCASGHFTRAAASHGAKVVGVDLSADIISVARNANPGIRFVAGTVAEAIDESETFDLIVGFDVIEHVLDPDAWTRDLAVRLRHGGYVVLTTPNLACGHRVGFEAWQGSRASFEHLYFFDAQTLCALLRRHGLYVIETLSNGSGIHQDGRTGGFRHRLRSLLERSGILATVRRARWRLSPPCETWQNNDLGHSLMMIAQKQ